MEIKKLIKSIFTHSCIYFTLITALYMAILQIANIEDGAAAAEAPRILLFYLASLLGAIASAIWSIKKINAVLRVLIHYLIWAFAFYACMLLPTNMPASNTVTGMVLFTLLYAVIMVVFSLFTARLRANREKPAEYKSQFSKNK